MLGAAPLFVAPTLVLQPAADVATPWIVMGPVYYAAALVPLVLAVERHDVAARETVDARRKIDIVRDEQRVAGIEGQDKTLMAVP